MQKIRTMCWIVTLSILFVGTMSCAIAKAESFLAPGVGLRALGMGGAFVAVADDITAVYWNPAGLSQLSALHAIASLPFPNKESFFATQFYGASAGIGPFGIGGLYANKKFLTGSAPEERGLVQLGVGAQIASTVRVGVGIKQYTHSLGSAHTQGMGVDLGAMIEPFSPLVVGMRMSDIGGVILRGKDPTTPADSVDMRVQLGAQVHLFNHQLRVCGSVDITQGHGVDSIHLGLEGTVNEMFSARAGWDNGQLTWGFGFGIKNLFDVEITTLSNGLTVSTELVFFGRKS